MNEILIVSKTDKGLTTARVEQNVFQINQILEAQAILRVVRVEESDDFSIVFSNGYRNLILSLLPTVSGIKIKE